MILPNLSILFDGALGISAAIAVVVDANDAAAADAAANAIVNCRLFGSMCHLLTTSLTLNAQPVN